MESNLEPNGDLTPEQWLFLSQFSANYVAGRKFMCWASRAVVALGILAAAVAAVVTAFHAIWPR